MLLKLRRTAVVLAAGLTLAAASIPTQAEAYGFLVAPAFVAAGGWGRGAYGYGGGPYGGGGWDNAGWGGGGCGCCCQVVVPPPPPPPPPCCCCGGWNRGYDGGGYGGWDRW